MRPELSRVVRDQLDQPLQKCGVAGSISAPLRRNPLIKLRTPVEVKPFQEFAMDERAKLLDFRSAKIRDPRAHRRFNLQDVDSEIPEVERDHLVVGGNSIVAWFIEHGPKLAEAPAQLCSRIARYITQKFTQSASRDRMSGNCEISKKGAYLARSRQFHDPAAPHHGKRSEHPYFGVDGRSGVFHARFHASNNAPTSFGYYHCTRRWHHCRRFADECPTDDPRMN
jgi:hypothetical protein